MKTAPPLIAAILTTVGLFAYAFSAETAVGAVHGRVLVDDTKQPLSGLTVVVRPSSPRSGTDTYTAKTEGDGSFTLARVPVGTYDVTANCNVYTVKPQKVTVREGERADAPLTLQPQAPFLRLYVHQRAILPEDRPRIALNGFRQGDAVNLKLYAVDGATLAHDYGGNLRKLLSPLSSTGTPATIAALNSRRVKQVRAWAHTVRERDAEGVFYEYDLLPRLPNGLYLIQAETKTDVGVDWLMVTDLALVTKSSHNQLLAYTVDLRTGMPVPAAALNVFRGAATIRRTTNAQGIAEISLPQSDDRVEAVALRGDSIAFSQIWGAGYGEEQRYRVYTYTDRPVYRPGHSVRFKGIVRQPQGIGYAVPSTQEVEVAVTDWQQTTIYEGTAQLNENGSFAGQFDIPSEAAGGAYNLTVTLDGEDHESGFAVASYRKPEWQVDVAFAKPHFISGESVSATIRAQYYYGAPVIDGKVHYTVYRSQHWRPWYEAGYADGEEELGNADEYGDVVAEGNAQTDADGTARITFDTNLEEAQDRSAEYQYNVEAEVSDLSGRAATGKGRVIVSPSEITLDAHADRYFAPPGSRVPVTVKVADLEEKPVGGVTLNATASLDVWDHKNSHQEQLWTGTATTGPNGEAALSIPLTRTGLVTVKIAARDRGNRLTEGTADVWVTTEEGGDLPSHYAQLSVVPDHKQYRIGDMAQVLVNTDRPGATAIVAVEAQRVLEYHLVPLKSRSTVVRLPIRPGYDPNVFVTACFVSGGEFSQSEARLNIDNQEHRLQVTVSSDRDVYHPRDTATFQVRTTDGTGTPVPAEVSFGLVDEAIYAIREDEKDGLWKAFYPRREHTVSTEFSYPNVYLGDANKDSAEVAVRKNFPDTATWQPFVHTDASGHGTIRVQLPDSLTSWRATVRAVTASTAIGEATYNVRVMRELTLRLQTPRAMTEGDHLTLTAAVHNYSPGPLDVSVDLRAQGLAVQGDTRRRIHLNPEQAQTVEWEAIATTPGTASVTATAIGGQYADGMQLSVPVLPFARERVFYDTGAVTGETASRGFSIDPAATDGEMELRISPTLAGTILGSLAYLTGYPYGCTEQTMSMFLPDVLVTRTLKALGIHRSELEQKLPQMTQAGLLRLYQYQHDPSGADGSEGGDGGWGWWEHDQSDPWMTGYVLFGLSLAKQSGIDVNEQVFENGIGALKKLAADTKTTDDDRMFIAYVLTVARHPKAAAPLLEKVAEVEKLSKRALGYRVLALAGSGRRSEAESALQYLWSISDGTGGMHHWNETRRKDGWEPPADVETTAVVLKAAVMLTPDDPRLGGVVRWLLLKRHGNRWESTRDTAWILFALTDYLKATGELRPDYRLSVALNGREIYTDAITPEDSLRDEIVVRLRKKDLAETNRLEVRKEGAGPAYYALKVTQQIPATAFAPESTEPGVSIQRDYYFVETRRDGVGRPYVAASKNPTTSARVGDRLLVRLRIHTTRPLEFLMVEDPLPAGCEVQDRGDVEKSEWDAWWSHTDVRDDRISLFARRVEPGDYALEYHLRPEMAGKLRVMPAVLTNMYVPSVRVATGEGRLEVAR